MAVTLRNYAHNRQLSTSATILVSAVAINTSAVIKKLSFYNSGSVVRTVTVYAVEASGTADAGNTEAKKAILPGDTWNVSTIQNEVLQTNMTLQASVDAGTDVNANCSGADVT